MSFVLDTNIVSDLRRRPNAGVVEWLQTHPPEAMFISVITLLEIEIGVRRIERTDPQQGEALRSWLDERVRREFEKRTLPLDARAATLAASFHVPDPAPEHDALIAATAAVHGFTVVTRNERDFARLGVAVVNPWSA